MATSPPDSRPPNPIDLHVGARVRTRRKVAGVSQEQLASALKLTFQQIQKYERGANRISASKLYEIAAFLKAPIAYFFEGLADPADDQADAADAVAVRAVDSFLSTPEGFELAENFARIGPGRVRRQVLQLVRAMADEPV
ncbi:helix-turn-helix transcriptional regulator [Caulobacter sp.]|uniref:helix-turn-helix domain-containing protein n=1 Tax=Caulobacter sp. TaxID=78 RepID=UPI0031D6DE15